MKKSVKAIIALVIIAVIGLGAFFILNRGTKNVEAYNKVYSLNNEIMVGNYNIYTRINGAIKEMSVLITNKGYNIPEVEAYFEFYTNTLNNYEIVRDSILDNGIFVNKESVGKFYSNMNKAYDLLVKEYEEANDYLLTTYFAITDPSQQNQDYLVNFHNIFKDALLYLNNFYYNAARVYAHGTKNINENNNLDKLYLECYAATVNVGVNEFISTGSENTTFMNYSMNYTSKLYNETISTYYGNKTNYDNILKTSKSLDVNKIILSDINSDINSYLSTLSGKEKSNAELYYNLVVRG